MPSFRAALRILVVWTLSASTAFAAFDVSELDPAALSRLGPDFNEYIRSSRGTDAYALSSRLNPWHLQADFNGDGTPDVAVLLREKASQKHGILIVHLGVGEHFILGAGEPLGSGGDDFAWMDVWQVASRASLVPNGDERETSASDGDVLWVIKTESASALLYWNGRRYEWHQLGD